jgi:hypothetical protein
MPHNRVTLKNMTLVKQATTTDKQSGTFYWRGYRVLDGWPRAQGNGPVRLSRFFKYFGLFLNASRWQQTAHQKTMF